MGGTRAWMVALAAAYLLAPMSAWGDSPPAYSPGDRVPFTVPDSQRGDRYTVRLDGHQVVKGADDTDDPGVSGEFTMPDLGSSAREVTQVVRVMGSSGGGTKSYDSTIDYRPAATAKPAPASKPAPRPPVPAPASGGPAARTAPPPSALPGSPQTSTGRSQRPSSGGKILRTPERVLRGLGRAAPLRHRGISAQRRKAKRHARHARHKANHFRAGPDPVPPKVRSLSPPRDTRRHLSNSSFPGLGYSVAWKLLAIVVGGGLILPFLVAARAQMRRRRELEMEAELQEMVAEGRADSLGVADGRPPNVPNE